MEADTLLYKAWAEHDLRVIDDGDGTAVDVAKAADRMAAAIDAIAAAMTTPAGSREAFEAWAPTEHMRTDRWAANPDLYDDENSISAWQGWEAGITWALAAAPAAPMSAQVFPMSGDEDESDLGDWQDGATKPALDGTYLREFDEGLGTSEFHDGEWLCDGFFPSDIQDARWRGRATWKGATKERATP